MAFLDNSGDIILDAVLTDTGRYRLAQGNGSFRIAKFALGDDEIDYSLYDKNASGGTAYYDLAILQTPVLEAFTNNASSLKSKLLTIGRTNLLYLPVIKLNNPTTGKSYCVNSNTKTHVLSADTTTDTQLGTQNFIKSSPVVQNGYSIRVDQGLDTREISTSIPIDEELRETQYIVEYDSRLFTIHNKNTFDQLLPSFVDDDLMATAYTAFANTSNTGAGARNESNGFITDLVPTNATTLQQQNNQDVPIIVGPYGTSLEFTLKPTTEITSNDYLFNTLGSTTATAVPVANLKYIDTSIRITGATTGYRLDVPVRIVKKP